MSKWILQFASTPNPDGMPGHLPANSWETRESAPAPFREALVEITDEDYAARMAVLTMLLPQATPAALWEAKLGEGWVDSVTGIKLKTTESAQAKFSQMVTLLSLALNVGQVAQDTPVSIWDYDDQERRLSVNDVFGLMLRYGFFCQQMFAEYAP